MRVKITNAWLIRLVESEWHRRCQASMAHPPREAVLARVRQARRPRAVARPRRPRRDTRAPRRCTTGH